MVKRGSQALTFGLAYLVWLLLMWDISPASLTIGLIVALAAAAIHGPQLTGRPEHAINPVRYFWFLYYIPIFILEMVKANLDMAYRVLHPALPIDPGLVKFRTRLKSETGRTLLGNSLTLTPGHTTVDIIRDELYIHCIDINRPTQAIAEKFENIIARIFE